MDDTKRTLKHLIVEQLKLKINPNEVREDEPLFGGGARSLGLDSLDALDMTLLIQDRFGVEIMSEQLVALSNLNAIAAYIEERSQVQHIEG